MTSNTSPNDNYNNDKTNHKAALGHIFTVATIQARAPRSIDISTIKTSSDLADLKKKDAFMYYSIPAVKKARMMGRDLDLSDMALTPANSTASSVVERRTRISVESRDIGIGGILDAMADLNVAEQGSNGQNHDDDIFMSFFRHVLCDLRH